MAKGTDDRPRLWWMTVNPFDITDTVLYSTLRRASADSIRRNKKDDNHPAYSLYEIDTMLNKSRYVGYLWREFGSDFNLNDCWMPECLD